MKPPAKGHFAGKVTTAVRHACIPAPSPGPGVLINLDLLLNPVLEPDSDDRFPASWYAAQVFVVFVFVCLFVNMIQVSHPERGKP